MIKHFIVTVFIFFLIACSDVDQQANKDYGPAKPRDRIVEQDSVLA